MPPPAGLDIKSPDGFDEGYVPSAAKHNVSPQSRQTDTLPAAGMGQRSRTASEGSRAWLAVLIPYAKIAHEGSNKGL